MDFVILAAVLGGVTLSNHRISKNRQFSRFFTWSLQGLWAYHLLFSWIFYRFVLTNGGDAIGYWELSADPSGSGETWLAHWGLGTFFVQWLNYLPVRILGLEFLTGHFLYAALSFIGFRELLGMLHSQQGEFREGWQEKVWVLLLFSPNLHFWTAGIGKEALLWLGLILVLKGLVNFPRYWLVMCAGILLTFLTRPFSSLILVAVLLLILPFQKFFQPYRKWALMTSALLLLSIGIYKWWQGYNQFGFSLTWIGEMFREQMGFLSAFKARSEVPMETYTLPERMWTVLFRPLWENPGDLWQIAASLENSIAILMMLLGLAGLFLKERRTIPAFLITGTVVWALMCLLFAFTLNNLGIMMRMKSIYMVIFYLTACFLFFRRSVR